MNIISAIVQLRDDILKWVATNLNKKVDKEDGKGLSSNDYTTTEKNKLGDIAEGANKTIVDTELSSDGVNPVQGGVIYAALDGKVDKDGDKVLSTYDFSQTYKEKLDGMDGAISAAIGGIDFPVDSVNGQTGAVVIEIPSVDGLASEGFVREEIGKIDFPVDSVNGQTGAITGLATESFVEGKVNAVAESISYPVTSVNSKTGAVSLTAGDVNAYTKEEISDFLSGKSDSSHAHSAADVGAYTKAEVDSLISPLAVEETVNAELSKKVDKVAGSRLITSEESEKLNALTISGGNLEISGSVNAANVTELDTYLNNWVKNSADETYGDDTSETQFSEQLRTILGDKADSDHEHSAADVGAYTREEVNNLISPLAVSTTVSSEIDGDIDTHNTATDAHTALFEAKANKTHTHTPEEVGADASGTASSAVDSHNSATDAHSSLFATKADKEDERFHVHDNSAVLDGIIAIDTTVTENSANLITSGGVYTKINGLRTITEDEINKLAKLELNGDDLSISGSVNAGSVTGLDTYLNDWVKNSVNDEYSGSSQYSGELRSALDSKADADSVYTKDETNNAISSATSGLAKSADVYTQAQTDSAIETAISSLATTESVNNALDLKADKATTYTKDETNNAISNATAGLATTENVTSLLAGKSDTGHTHDDYAEVGHSHDELHTHGNKDVLDGIDAQKVSDWDAKSEFSGYYKDLMENPIEVEETDDRIVIQDGENNAVMLVDANGLQTTSIEATSATIGRITVGELESSATIKTDAIMVYRQSGETDEETGNPKYDFVDLSSLIDTKADSGHSHNPEDIGAEVSGAASEAVNSHNTSETAHNDIRLAIDGKADADHSHSYSDVGAEKAGTASNAVNTHNTASDAHADIREAIEGKVSKNGTDRLITAAEGQKLEALTLNGGNLEISGSVNAANVTELEDYLDGWVGNSLDDEYGVGENATEELRWSAHLRNAFGAKADTEHTHLYEAIDGAPNIASDVNENEVLVMDSDGNTVAKISASGLETTTVTAYELKIRSVETDTETGDSVTVDLDVGAAIASIPELFDGYATETYVGEQIAAYSASVDEVMVYLGL